MLKIFLLFSFLFVSNISASQNDLVRDIFFKSSRYQLWLSKQQELQSGKRSALSSIPLRMDSSLYRTMPTYGDKTETALLGSSVLESSDVLSVDLVYQRPSSLKNTLSLDYTRNTYDTNYATDSTARSYDISNKIEYNFTNGASNAERKIAQDQEVTNLSLNELQSIKNLNSDYLDFFQKVMTYFMVDCKIKNQQQVKGIVDQTIERGKALLSINSISKKDYLNYESLQIDLEKTLANLTNDLYQAKYDIEALGLNFKEAIDEVKFGKMCQFDKILGFNENASDVKGSIDLEIITKQMELSSLEVKNAKRDTISDVTPFVEIGMSSDLGKNSKDYRIVAGVSVGWDLPHAKLSNNIKYKNLGKNYNAGDYQFTKRKMEFELTGLKQDIKYLTQIVDITKRNLKSNDELLKILKLEQSLRKGDSLNFANSVNNRISLINNYYDLVLQMETKLAQIKLIQEGKYLVK